MYVIYLDVLFIINLIMNLLTFSVATMLLNRYISFRKLIGASILATLLYCMFILVPVLQELPVWVGTIVVPILPITIIYKPHTLKKLMKYYGVCMGVAALMGGMVFSIWYMLKQTRPVYEISIFWLVGIGIGIWGIIYLGFSQIRKRFIMPYFTYNLELTYDQKKIKCKGLLDTGNCLYTVIGHKPVLVIAYDAIKDILSNKQIKMIELAHYNVQKIIELNEDKLCHLIPFSSVGCKAGLLWGIEVDEVVIERYGQRIHVEHCIAGVAFQRLFVDETCKALVHPDFIMNEGELL